MIYILQGYQVCIISGSPYIYTKYLTKYLPVQNIIGPEPNGLITYGVGKVTYAKQYTGSQLNSLAGYVGDTWNNDGLLLSTAKNYNINSDCQFILHGQQNNSDTIANLEKYCIIQIYAY
jgi:phosphoserine phosphatase